MSAMSDAEQPHHELVKCVVVGDNGVGKTRLICARAWRKKMPLAQLLNTHVPTVWAIDQYRIYKEVLANSLMALDGVNVSLRLWDTFGDHHKDRRFAYLRSDVVIMCFDVGRRSSLENCREMWIKQVRQFCPNTPVLLVGCKNDLRFIVHDDRYQSYCRERSPLVRQVREHDLVMPDQGRAVAAELGLPYYETSVLTYFGVTEVFENAVRAALCARRARFTRIMSGFRKLPSSPALQEPFCPPRPDLPSAAVIPSSFAEDRAKMLRDQNFTDLIFICEGIGFPAHRFVMATCSPFLLRLLTASPAHHTPPTRSSSEASLLGCSLGSSVKCMDSGGCGSSCSSSDDESCSDTKRLLPSSRRREATPGPTPTPASNSCAASTWCRRLSRRRRSISFNMPNTAKQEKREDSPKPVVFRSINHPAIRSLRVQKWRSVDTSGRVHTSWQTIVTCTKLVTAQAMVNVLRFAYTGEIDANSPEMQNIKLAAEHLNIPDLQSLTVTILNGECPRNRLKSFRKNVEDICLVQGQFTDVLFRLDDGAVAAHKAVLMARSDMMQAMFTHEDFVEKSAEIIKFPGVSRSSFEALLHFLYTDCVSSSVDASSCAGVLELANRMCLARLVSLVEEKVIAQLTADSAHSVHSAHSASEATAAAIRLLQPCQVHNADQLSEWCLSFLAQNYNSVCKSFAKDLRGLHPENQAWLNVHRWPPIWYLKDYDVYQRQVLDREREMTPKKKRRRSRTVSASAASASASSAANNASGCLCFSTRGTYSD